MVVKLSAQLLTFIGEVGGLAVFSAVFVTSKGMLELYDHRDEWQDHCRFLRNIDLIVSAIRVPDLQSAILLNRIEHLQNHLWECDTPQKLHEAIEHGYMWMFKRAALWHSVPRAWMVREIALRFLEDNEYESAKPFLEHIHETGMAEAIRTKTTWVADKITEWGNAYIEGTIGSIHVRKQCDVALLNGCWGWLVVPKSSRARFSFFRRYRPYDAPPVPICFSETCDSLVEFRM